MIFELIFSIIYLALIITLIVVAVQSEKRYKAEKEQIQKYIDSVGEYIKLLEKQNNLLWGIYRRQDKK
jgi:hypothetical protein